jgi:DNA (cytosine-5)-methyltransferase 1
MSLGFEQAGFDIVAAVEIDPVHCAVHKFNFPHCAIIPRSVVGLKGSEIRLAAGIGNRTVDVVFGGAPCQGFSMIGQRVLDDPRNRLVLEFLRVVSELEAKSFVFENVKGLTVGRHKQFLDEFVAEARRLGYEIRLPWRVLNASHFGTPQNRERLILYGAKREEHLPNYPKPTTRPADGRGKLPLDLPLGPSVADAIGDLPDADSFDELVHTDAVRTDAWGAASVYAAKLRCKSNDAWHYSYVRNWDPSVLTGSIRTDHSAISRRRFAETEGGQTEPISRFYKLSENGLSNTLRAGTDGARGAFTSPRPIHFRHARCVTVREMARLHGYPDWFRLHSTKWHGARQIGNSVPPPLAREVAASLIEALGYVTQRPYEIVDLGSPELLEMTVSQAAEHFGIAAPPSKRDKKSGAKKRKQADIEAEIRMRKSSANG